MRRAAIILTCLVVLTLVTAVPLAAQEEEEWEMRPTPTPYPPMTCAEAAAKGLWDAALQPCREELATSPDSSELIRLNAQAEFAEGDPYRSAALWRQLLDRAGWDDDAARGVAMAEWRAGEISDAEALLRERLEHGRVAAAYHDLIDFLLGFDRFSDAVETATAAIQVFPGDCRFLEDQGVAEAGLGQDAKAAQLIGRAVAGGCPRYRWTTRGVLSGRLDNPAYRPLLKPAELVQGLASLSDTECQQRFRLLQAVVTPEVAPAITDQILSRKTADVRLAGIGLLARLGSRALDSYRRLLASDDFILRKRVLREIREQHDAGFVPLLEAHLDKEPLPHNKTLTMLTLGELLLDGKEPARGQELLLGIPAGDPVYAVARLELSERAEKRGDVATARRLVEDARASDPRAYIDPQRLERLGIPPATPAPEQATTPLPSEPDPS